VVAGPPLVALVATVVEGLVVTRLREPQERPTLVVGAVAAVCELVPLVALVL
jgi:hypothetical protein